MSFKIRYPRQLPISKDIDVSPDYYIPPFVVESSWKRIDINSWFTIMYYTYNRTNKSKKVCSIDVGSKYFITLYALNGTCFKVKCDYSHIDRILKDTNLSYDNKDIIITNMIQELHIRSAQFICNMYDEIYVGLILNRGNINSKKMLSVEDNLLKILCHSEFLTTFREIAKKKKKILHVVDESFTSCQCTNCFETNKFKRIFHEDDSIRRMYICEYCNIRTCRDLAASRNILIKNQKN